MLEVVQHALNSLPVGSEYALVALGLTLMFGVLGIPNIAHGGVYMFGAFTAYAVTSSMGLPFAAGVVSGTVAGAVIGLVVQVVAFERLKGANSLTLMVSALAALTILTQFALLSFGTESRRIPVPVEVRWEVGPVIVPVFNVLLAAVTIAVGLGLILMVKRTAFGRGMRAMAENPEAALLMGVSKTRVMYGTFAIGSAIGGFAGSVLGTALPVNAEMGLDTVLKAFVVIVVGGIGSVGGALVVGLLLGLVETLAAAYAGGEYRDIVAFVILVVFLVARPEGLVRARGMANSRAVPG